MHQNLFQIQWANKAPISFENTVNIFVSHSFNALRTLLTKHPTKKNKEPTGLETNSQNALSKRKTVNP